MGSALEARKQALLAKLANLDSRADAGGITHDEWAQRYTVDDEMIFILRCEEMYWQQWGQQKWVVEGDLVLSSFMLWPTGGGVDARFVSLGMIW